MGEKDLKTLTTADLLVLVLRVLPGEIRESLTARQDLPEKGEERSGTPRSVGGYLRSEGGKGPNGNVRGLRGGMDA